MMTLRRLFSVCALLAVAACGGGGGGGSPFGGDAGGGGGGTTPPPATGTVADLVIVLASGTLVNTSTTPVSVTVTALDANRNAISGAAVTLAANSNAVVTVTSGATTNAQGQLLATVSYGSDTNPRAVTLTAASGSVAKNATLQIVSGTSVQPAAIDLIASASEVGTGGAGITIQAFVKDASNNALANAPVVFTANTGTLANVSSNTNASGVATATFSSGANKANRTATITVTSQTVSANLSIPINNTKLTVSGPSSMVLGDMKDFFVIATDSANNPIPNATITSTGSLGNAITRPDGNVTNSQGSIRFRYTATNPGTDSGLKFSGLGGEIGLVPSLFVSGDDFSFVSPIPSTTVPVNTFQEVRVRLRVGGVPLVGRTVNFATTGGTLSEFNPPPAGAPPPSAAATASTNGNGEATVYLRSSAAGPVTVQASVAGVATSATLALNIVATVPATLVLQISPTALPINASGANANNEAQAIARVTDAAANPVAGVTVNFTRITDPSGGNLVQASDVTDSSGVATVAYRSGPESTASNGVRLRATVAINASVFAEATLTVNQSALFITLGTGNTIENLDPQTYKKDWVAYVTDANGVAVNNVTLTNKILPLVYRTGRLAFLGTVWTYVTPIYECKNEDINSNGVLNNGSVASVTVGATTTFITAPNTLMAGNTVRLTGFTGADASMINGRTFAVSIASPTSFEIVLDTSGKTINGPGTFSEDDNGDGVLWPGNVIAVTPASVPTAGGGRATLSLIYAESFAPWVGVRLTASATVAGTESRRDAEFVVTGSSVDFSTEANPPAGVTSPFGLSPQPALAGGQTAPSVGGLWPNNPGCRRIL